MKTTFFKYLEYACWFGFFASIIALGIIYFMNWDRLLTHKEWFFLQLKPSIALIVNYIALQFLNADDL